MKTQATAAALFVLFACSGPLAFAQEEPEPVSPRSPGAASATGDDIAALRRAIDRERQAREALEKRLDEREAAPATATAAAPFPIQVSGFVHMDWVAWRQSSQDEVTQDGQPLNEDRFVLRRARIRAEGEHGYVHGVLEVDANTISGLQVRPIDAEATFKWPKTRPYARLPWAYDPIGTGAGTHTGTIDPRVPEPTLRANEPWFMVTAGLFRTPFGFEVPEPERDRPLLERTTMSNSLFPQSFDLGLRFVGGYRFVRWAFAVMNGNPIGEQTFPGRDPTKSKDLVFRIGGAGALTSAVRFEGGLSAITGQGFHRGTPATKNVVSWRDDNNDGFVDATELNVIAGAPASASQTFRRFALGADLRATVAIPRLGDLSLRGEIVRAKNLDRLVLPSDPVAGGRDFRQFGWYVGGSQEITPWAMLGIRYDRYDPDSDANEQEPYKVVPRDLAQSTWSFNLTGRIPLARLSAQYDHRTNALGRDASGRPTTLADDSFTMRAEVRF